MLLQRIWNRPGIWRHVRQGRRYWHGRQHCLGRHIGPWTSTGPIIAPVSDASHPLTAVKDPSIVRYGDRWHVFASSVSTKGAYSVIYTSFADWADAPTAPMAYLDQTPGLNGYLAAPQVFYFAPKKKWYLVYQSGPPMYSTSSDISNPKSWTAPAKFYASDPAIIAKDGWLDFWVICDTQNCYIFFLRETPKDANFRLLSH